MPKILIIEDNADIGTLICRHLERSGYQAIVAGNGELGVDVAAAEQPDLILMDMNMPVLDGWEATKLIKGVESLSELPIIALSAHGQEGDQQKALEMGCVAYHRKPVEFPLLLAEIERVLRSSMTMIEDEEV